MILVTGGTGLVGAHLLLHLTRQNLAVRAIYRQAESLEKVRKVFSYYTPKSEALFKKIQWVPADINNLPSLEPAFEQVSHVYHCAALISFHPGDFPDLLKVNTEGTANIVNLCLAYGIKKMCYVSSVATISRPADGGMATEENYGTDRYPNVYAISKEGAEMEVWRGSQEGLPVVIVNPGIILGPGQWSTGSGVIFEKGARKMVFAPPGGTGFVAATDVAECMVQLMDSGITNERFILVAENQSYKNVLQQVRNVFGKSKPIRVIPIWVLEMLWRFDWLRCLFVYSKRKLTRSAVTSLKNPVAYKNDKILQALEFEFQPVEESLAFCCNCYISDHPGLFN